MKQSRLFASIVLVLLSPQLLFGRSEGGHHLIGYMAFKLLKPEKQEKLIELIKQHQPCHAGSLYCEQFRKKDGDRGANSIETDQSKNLYAVWDQLLGPRFDHSDAKRRIFEIENDTDLKFELLNALGRSSPVGNNFRYTSTWPKESVAAAQFVYTQEVIGWVQGDRSELLKLTEEYLERAGRTAQVRALLAAHRLADAWEKAL